jgi:hypothetical protein
MFPDFFVHKMREVASFLQIVKGKVKGDSELRSRGVENALNVLEDERKVYEKEKKAARRGEITDPAIDRTGEMIDKPVRESENRDISAI